MIIKIKSDHSPTFAVSVYSLTKQLINTYHMPGTELEIDDRE